MATEKYVILIFVRVYLKGMLMSKSPTHKNAQSKAAGKNGTTEAKIKGNQRIDAISANKKRATEVERSGNLNDAVSRLKNSGASQKILQVPQKDMKRAAETMKQSGIKGTIKNMSGTKRKSVQDMLLDSWDWLSPEFYLS
jgi:hypothetical protein